MDNFGIIIMDLKYLYIKNIEIFPNKRKKIY